MGILLREGIWATNKSCPSYECTHYNKKIALRQGKEGMRKLEIWKILDVQKNGGKYILRTIENA